MTAPRKSITATFGLVGLAALSLSVGCDDDRGGARPRAVAVPQAAENILVMDNGLDPGVPVFAGKLAATYTLTCLPPPMQPAPAEPAPPAPAPAPPPPSFEAEKAAYIAALRHKDVSCFLAPGIAPKPDPLADLGDLRERWNAFVENREAPGSTLSMEERDRIRAAFDKQLPKVGFHGTATAGVIAHINPRLRLVLVEIPLSTAEEVREGFTCIKQPDIDRAVALLTDKDVRAAYARQPRSRLEEDNLVLHATHGIGAVNMSYGTFARSALEDLQKSKGCDPVDLRPYFKAQSDLYLGRERAQPSAPALYIQAAGNEGALIDGPQDSADCGETTSAVLRVGSLDRAYKRSGFSNFGHCVHVYAPGEQIIAPVPGGWQLPLSGTSFAAPLVARLQSLSAQQPFDPHAAKDRTIVLGDSMGHLPMDRFPPALMYVPMTARIAAAPGKSEIKRLLQFPALDYGPARYDLGGYLRGPLPLGFRRRRL